MGYYQTQIKSSSSKIQKIVKEIFSSSEVLFDRMIDEFNEEVRQFGVRGFRGGHWAFVRIMPLVQEDSLAKREESGREGMEYPGLKEDEDVGLSGSLGVNGDGYQVAPDVKFADGD